MVIRECGNLLAAIDSVGRSLRGKSYDRWEFALTKLQQGAHQEIPEMSIQENAYKCFKFCFDELPREETKKCLLLCSLFPQDNEICVENLTRYVHGLGLYQHTGSIEDTISQVSGAIDQLQDVRLLLEGENKGLVKMHKLVRDIVRLIGKSYSVVTVARMVKEFVVGGDVGFNGWPTDERFREYSVISLLENEIRRLPDHLDSPRLEMLLLARRAISPEGYTSSHQEYTEIADKSFEGMEKLRVLSVTRCILSLQSLETLTNLCTLELRYFNFASGDNGKPDLALLKHLNKLEILSSYGSDIWELPDEMGELENLKLLDLINCYGLQRIPSCMIRKLSKLEELLIGVFEEWDEGIGNANLMDIHKTYLPNVAIFVIDVSYTNSRSFFVLQLNWVSHSHL